ncbi:MAG: biopolymer transporter ExbD [Roseibium sp.]|uniref:ExbD/TolR family protein n=1 Tax=Roseibium sp. TaxID=1936156 RepID=UPI00263122FC|nr:biopolymer transporter ExbD [Roseibium sp.]MCV0429430.1 biopolymer transporter ExbD [Roseibium sp.]
MILIHSPVGKHRRIPLMPLIDVIFILVMFFLLSSTFGVWRPLDVSLGGGGDIGVDNRQSTAETPPILITIRSVPGEQRVRVTVNGVEKPLEQLAAELNRLTVLGAQTAVLVPAKGTEFQQVVTILDEARSSRIRSVSLKID